MLGIAEATAELEGIAFLAPDAASYVTGTTLEYITETTLEVDGEMNAVGRQL